MLKCLNCSLDLYNVTLEEGFLNLYSECNIVICKIFINTFKSYDRSVLIEKEDK